MSQALNKLLKDGKNPNQLVQMGKSFSQSKIEPEMSESIPESLDEIENQIKKLKGIYIDSVPKRIYPNNELLAQTLGFVGIDNVGLSGIEYQFNDELKGEPKILKYVIDNKGHSKYQLL